eukprot:5952173-Alexandrium_andersonii.AAC.1
MQQMRLWLHRVVSGVVCTLCPGLFSEAWCCIPSGDLQLAPSVGQAEQRDALRSRPAIHRAPH